jgi:hypothetical protein
MTKYVRANQAVSDRIIKGKKGCTKVFIRNFLFLVVCWAVTGVVTFASFGVYVFWDFAFFFAGLKFELFSAVLGIILVLPMYLGNIKIVKYLIKGRKADLYLLFEGYFNFKKLCKWVLGFIVSVSPGWIFTLLTALFASETYRFLPFVREDILTVVSVIAELLTLYLFFINMCKSVYFLLGYSITEDVNFNINKNQKKYMRMKQYFKKYLISHLYLFIALFFVSKLPLYASSPIFVLIIGYLVLSVASFNIGFGIKIKNINTGGCKKI